VAHVAALDVLDQPVHDLVESGVVERDRVRVTNVGPSAQRQQ
jgi:hypothetical protein